MKKKTIVVALTTLLIGSLCFWACQKDEVQQVKPVETEDLLLKSGHQGTKMVPFKGKGTWQVIDSQEIDEGFQVIGEIKGTATRLGRLQGVDTVYFSPTLEYLTHTNTLTAANGDILYFAPCVEKPDSGYNFNPDDQDGPWDWHGKHIRLVFGTGRFENAVGYYNIWGTGSPEIGYGTWRLEGEISTVGSNK